MVLFCDWQYMMSDATCRHPTESGEEVGGVTEQGPKEPPIGFGTPYWERKARGNDVDSLRCGTEVAESRLPVCLSLREVSLAKGTVGYGEGISDTQ